MPQQEIRLDWPGRAWTPRSTPKFDDALRRADVIETGTERAKIIFGDALDAAQVIASSGEKAHLVYVDPPYASQADYVSEARLDGSADGRTRRTAAFGDRWRGPDGVGAYLEMLAPRLEAAAHLLRDDGSLWVHLDWRAAYLVRVILDEIFAVVGGRFINEIIWRRAPNLGRQAASAQFGRTLDTIIVYGRENAKITPPTRLEEIEASAVRIDEQNRPFTTAPRGDYTDASIEKLDREGRVHRTASGRVYIKYFLVKDKDGRHFRERRVDALWTDIPPLRHAKTTERTGYPTQKPVALLDRIIRCATPDKENALVVDLFSGSGTTAVAAVLSGRRAIVSDQSPVAIATARSRLLRENVAPTIESIGGDLPRGVARAECVGLDFHSGGTRVILHEPSMPLAWAVDSRGTPSKPFSATWNAERILGRATEPIATFVDVEFAKSPIRVRAWGDDGTLHETTLTF